MDITTCDSWAIHLSRVRNFWYFWNFWPIWYFLLHVIPWCSDHEFYFIACFQMFAACAQSGCVPTRHFLSCSLQSPAERCWQQRVSAEELFEDGPGSPRQSMLSPRGRDGLNVWRVITRSMTCSKKVLVSVIGSVRLLYSHYTSIIPQWISIKASI